MSKQAQSKIQIMKYLNVLRQVFEQHTREELDLLNMIQKIPEHEQKQLLSVLNTNIITNTITNIPQPKDNLLKLTQQHQIKHPLQNFKQPLIQKTHKTLSLSSKRKSSLNTKNDKVQLQIKRAAEAKAYELIQKLNGQRKQRESKFLKAKLIIKSTQRKGFQIVQNQQIRKSENIKIKNTSPQFANRQPEANKIKQKTWLSLFVRQILFSIVNKIVSQENQNLHKKKLQTPLKLDLQKHSYFKSKFRMQLQLKQKQKRQIRYKRISCHQKTTKQKEINMDKKSNQDSKNSQILSMNNEFDGYLDHRSKKQKYSSQRPGSQVNCKEQALNQKQFGFVNQKNEKHQQEQ